MKKTEFKIKLKGLTNVELEELLLDNSNNLSKLKMNHKTAELENPIELRDIRRNIARINTELRAREIQQVNK
ncbi:MAG: 50S ribosomal protein L29 [Crocinitomicaceae bacterium]|nr:50S ribosomal protein L29 [Crocinitomicaceae bacterium]|tara:strand:+ start:65 stop:280 length:216 start_codon:yes stop_codon:yes gene_type:complete